MAEKTEKTVVEAPANKKAKSKKTAEEGVLLKIYSNKREVNVGVSLAATYLKSKKAELVNKSDEAKIQAYLDKKRAK